MDRWLSRLERRYGRYAPGNLTWYLVGLQGLTFLLNMVRPGIVDLLTLDPARVAQGQVWRLFTYVILPPSDSPIWVLFALWWLHTMGTALEAEWGAFKYALYWFVGMICTSVCAFVFKVPATNAFLLQSLFLGFATIFPDYRIMLFFVLPVAVKWLALLDAVFMLVQVGSLDGYRKLLPLVAVGNYFLFFGSTLRELAMGYFRTGGRARARQKFRDAEPDLRERERRCAKCGVTDADRSVEFRICTCEKCGRPTEFCLTHARDH